MSSVRSKFVLSLWQQAVCIEAEAILRWPRGPIGRWRHDAAVLRPVLLQEPLDLLIALTDQRLALPIERHGLTQREDMLRPIVAGECLGDRLLVVLAPHMAMLRQLVGIPLAHKDVVDEARLGG